VDERCAQGGRPRGDRDDRVALLQMLPQAVPDLVTGLLTLATVVTMTAWRLGPLPLMTAGGAVGVVLRPR